MKFDITIQVKDADAQDLSDVLHALSRPGTQLAAAPALGVGTVPTNVPADTEASQPVTDQPGTETPDPAIEAPDPATETPDPATETPDPASRAASEAPDPASGISTVDELVARMESVNRTPTETVTICDQRCAEGSVVMDGEGNSYVIERTYRGKVIVSDETGAGFLFAAKDLTVAPAEEQEEPEVVDITGVELDASPEGIKALFQEVAATVSNERAISVMRKLNGTKRMSELSAEERLACAQALQRELSAFAEQVS
jgi:hypothetical protein